MKKVTFSLLLMAATFCSYGQITEGIGIKLTPISGDTEISSKSPVFKNLGEMRAVPAHLLDTGTIYFRNTAGIFVPFKWNPTSTATDDSASVIQRTGTSTGRFELYYEHFIMVDWFGAVPDDAYDDSYYVQKAVNFSINSSKAPEVRFRGGLYHVNNVKLAKKNGNEYFFSTVEIRGNGFTNHNKPGTTIMVDSANGVGFFVQNGRQTIIDNIAFIGQLTTPASVQAVFTMTDEEYTTGVRNNKYSPHAAIADGAFASSVASGDQYPGQSAWYTNTSNSGTSGLRITNCVFSNFNVAIIQGSNAKNANGDNVNIEACTFQYNRIVYAPCQTQSRANSIVNCYMLSQQYVVNASEFGDRLGTPPNLVQCNIAEATKYVYYIRNGFGGMTIDRCRMESVFSLGKSSGLPVNFINCEITPGIPGEGFSYGAVKFAEGSHVSFKGGMLQWFDNYYVAGFVFDVENLSFDGVSLGGLPINLWSGPVSNFFLNRTVYNNCKFYSVTTNGDVWQAGTWQGIEFSNFRERSAIMPATTYVENNAYGYAMFNAYESLSPKIELIPIESTTLDLNPTNATATFTAADPGAYKLYDVLCDPFQARTMPGSIYTNGPSVLGWVYEIDGNTIKIKYVPYGLDESTTYSIQIARVPKFLQKVIGNLTSGNNTITSAKYYGSYLTGMMIKGPGLPPGTRVVSVSGGTITLSRNATANVNDVEFFDARMHCNAVGNPTDASSTFGYYRGDIMRNNDVTTSNVAYWVCTRGGWIVGGSPQTPLWEPVYRISNLTDGSYTATLTNGTNITGTTFRSAQYQQVGNTITLFVVLDINATAAGAFNVDISLPVASGFTTAYEAGGTASNGVSTGSVYSSAANDRLILSGTAAASGSTQWTVHVTYKVL